MRAMGAARALSSQQGEGLGAAKGHPSVRGLPGLGGWDLRAAGSTCRAEEEDGGLAQLLVDFVGHRGLSLCQGGEDISVSLAHAGVDVVKEQREGAAPHGSHLRAQTRAAGIPGQQRAPRGRRGTSGHSTDGAVPAWAVPREQPHHASGSLPSLGTWGSAPACARPQCCPASSRAWLVLLLPPVRHPWSPQLSVTVTGTAHWPPGTPELLPLCSSTRDLHPHTSPWGGHRDHTCAPCLGAVG